MEGWCPESRSRQGCSVRIATVRVGEASNPGPTVTRIDSDEELIVSSRHNLRVRSGEAEQRSEEEARHVVPGVEVVKIGRGCVATTDKAFGVGERSRSAAGQSLSGRCPRV